MCGQFSRFIFPRSRRCQRSRWIQQRRMIGPWFIGLPFRVTKRRLWIWWIVKNLNRYNIQIKHPTRLSCVGPYMCLCLLATCYVDKAYNSRNCCPWLLSFMLFMGYILHTSMPVRVRVSVRISLRREYILTCQGDYMGYGMKYILFIAAITLRGNGHCQFDLSAHFNGCIALYQHAKLLTCNYFSFSFCNSFSGYIFKIKKVTCM